MSIRDAIMSATRQTLSHYLAPELTEQLTDEILHRMAPDLEAALTALAGFEMGRANAPARVRGATAPAASKKNKAKPRKDDDVVHAAEAERPSLAAHHSNGNGNGGATPSVEAVPSH